MYAIHHSYFDYKKYLNKMTCMRLQVKMELEGYYTYVEQKLILRHLLFLL